MKEQFISVIEAGQRFDKYLAKCLPNATKGFIYKMLRKKNITLNGKKADGSEKIRENDIVKMFFSDETYEAMSGKKTIQSKGAAVNNANDQLLEKAKNILKIEYENEHILIVNKPSGILSQKAKNTDISMVEYISAYINSNPVAGLAAGYKPGICNRLDRNTSGLLVAGKTVAGLQYMTEKFRNRDMSKYYVCIVTGCFNTRMLLNGYIYKNEKTNRVTVYKENEKNIPEGAEYIETEFIPVTAGKNISLLKVHLITGKTHQIRAHLAYCEHAIIGDTKYGKASVNSSFKTKYNINSQLLHAFELNIPKNETVGIMDELSVITQLPDEFIKCLKGEKLWAPGIQEALEALH